MNRLRGAINSHIPKGLRDLVRGSTAGWLPVVPTPECTLGLSTHLFVDAHGGGEFAIFFVFSRFHALADRPVHRWIGMLGAQGFDPGFLRGSGSGPATCAGALGMGKTHCRHQRHSGQRNYQTMGHLISPLMRTHAHYPRRQPETPGNVEGISRNSPGVIEYAVHALSAAVCLKTKPAGEPPAFNFFAMI
jgi:hypothetical protein